MGISERRQRDKERRRQDIVHAAQTVFADRGFDVSTMDEVAAVAEVSKGTLYLYFKNKDSLLAAIAERWVAELIETLKERVSAAPTGLQGVRAVLQSYRTHFETHPQHCRMAMQVIQQGDSIEGRPSYESHSERVRELVSLVMATIKRGQEDHSIRPDVRPELLAPQLWGSFLGLWMLAQHPAHVKRRLPMQVDLGQLSAAFDEILLRGIATHPEEVPT